VTISPLGARGNKKQVRSATTIHPRSGSQINWRLLRVIYHNEGLEKLRAGVPIGRGGKRMHPWSVWVPSLSVLDAAPLNRVDGYSCEP